MMYKFTINQPLHGTTSPLKSILVIVIGSNLLHKGRENALGIGRAIGNSSGNILHFIDRLAKSDGTRCRPGTIEPTARAGSVLVVREHPKRWPETFSNGEFHASRDSDHLVTGIPRWFRRELAIGTQAGGSVLALVGLASTTFAAASALGRGGGFRGNDKLAEGDVGIVGAVGVPFLREETKMESKMSFLYVIKMVKCLKY